MAEIGEIPMGWSTFTSGCAECIPVAPDGITELDVLFSDGGVGPSNRFSWSFIEATPGGELVYMASTNSPFVVNQQMYLSTNAVTSSVTVPLGLPPFSNNVPGVSDRPIFIVGGGAGVNYVFTLEDNYYATIDFNGHGYSTASLRNWSVNGNLFFGGGETTTIDDRLIVAKFLFNPGDITGVWQGHVKLESGLIGVASVHYDGEFVYVLGSFSGANYKLYRYDTDFNLVAEFALTTVADEPYISAYNIGDFTYVVKRRFGTAGVVVAISYVDNMTSQVVLDENVTGTTPLATDSGPGVLWVTTDESSNLKYLYFGKQTGQNIWKFGPVPCAS